MDLHDKVVLITGGSHGLGLALARRFAQEGAELVLCARSKEELDRAAEDVATTGAEVFTAACKVSDRLQVEALVTAALNRFSRTDVLVNGRERRIVNITSIGAKVSVPHLVPYSCAKFAAAAFSEGMRTELCGTGVKVVTGVV